jgi:hypothetical protein
VAIKLKKEAEVQSLCEEEITLHLARVENLI